MDSVSFCFKVQNQTSGPGQAEIQTMGGNCEKNRYVHNYFETPCIKDTVAWDFNIMFFYKSKKP